MPIPRRAIAVPSARAASRYFASTDPLDPANTQTRTMLSLLACLAEHALEHRVYVPQLALQIERGVQVLGGEQLLHLGILGEQRLEVLALVPHLHRIALHHHVRGLPLHPALDQLEQDRLRK